MKKLRTNLNVTDKDGLIIPCSYTMEKTSNWPAGDYIFQVFPDEYHGKEYHETHVSAYDENTVCVVDMCNHLPQIYRKRRIGAAILQEVILRLGKKVCSNRWLTRGPGEWRDDEEILDWEYLISVDLAEYDKESDRHWLKNSDSVITNELRDTI